MDLAKTAAEVIRQSSIRIYPFGVYQMGEV